MVDSKIKTYETHIKYLLLDKKKITIVKKTKNILPIIQENKYVGIFYTLRKHAYSNIMKILPPKNENF